MPVLHHHPLYGSARTARLVLGERRIAHLPKVESPWLRSQDFLTLNPSGEVPVFVTENDEVLCGAMVIAEYVDETGAEKDRLIWGAPEQRAETRRLVDWFEHKFKAEVGAPLVQERFIKRVSQSGNPCSQSMRAAVHNLHVHLDYVGWLSEQNGWLAGRSISLADLSAAAHISVVDFFGDVDWARHPDAKSWYAKIKSRPSFRDLLVDAVKGLPPAEHYGNLDF